MAFRQIYWHELSLFCLPCGVATMYSLLILFLREYYGFLRKLTGDIYPQKLSRNYVVGFLMIILVHCCHFALTFECVFEESYVSVAVLLHTNFFLPNIQLNAVL
jgi:hypothetical protein